MIDNSKSFRPISTQAGSSLVEILVSVIIISIGLLGLAALQNTSLKLSYDSYLRTQGSFLAYDLIDRIRANPDGGSYSLAFNETPIAQDCFNGDNCTEDEIRKFDLFYWRRQAETLLPEAKVDIQFDIARSVYTLRIEWADRSINDVEEGVETKEFIYTFKV